MNSNRHNPRYRLTRPISLQSPRNYPAPSLRPYEFTELSHRQVTGECVYDPENPVTVPGPKFSGDFESGNLGSVYHLSQKVYEIHIIPDPNESETAQWFFFKVDNLDPGDYTFIICGFYRQCNLHNKGSQICAYSVNEAKTNGRGWQRLGDNMNYFKYRKYWALSFSFIVRQKDSMYFAHSYPYTYTDLMKYLDKQTFSYSILCKTLGEIPVPVIFWDAEKQRTVDIDSYMRTRPKSNHPPSVIRTEYSNEFSQELIDLVQSWRDDEIYVSGTCQDLKPLCVIAARTHPGETNSSFAMEYFMNFLFGQSMEAKSLREHFSFLLIPMNNPDGVICGYYRPCLCGDDMNRIWQSPNAALHKTTTAILDLLEILSRKRSIMFFLDFHGHTAACNSFVYGFENELSEFQNTERVFPLLMTKYTNLFSNQQCSYLKQKTYEGTMRVVIRRKFHVVFAYTLEMSYGGCDFGPQQNVQFTPKEFGEIGEATGKALHDLLLNSGSLAGREIMNLLTVPGDSPNFVSSTPQQVIVAQFDNSKHFFTISANDITLTEPSTVRLHLYQSPK